MPEKITSLCYVTTRYPTTTRLCRIADFISEDFVPYTFRRGASFFDTDRDLIIARTEVVQAEQGSMIVVDWSVSQDSDGKWLTDAEKSDVQWVEVRLLPVDDLPAIVRLLQEGWKPESLYDLRHDLILCCQRAENSLEGLFLPSSMMKKRDGKFYLDENVTTLPTGTIDRRYGFQSCQCRDLAHDGRYYLTSLAAWHPKGNLPARNTEDLLNALILTHVRKIASEHFSRKERQLVVSVFEKINETSLTEDVAQKFHLSHDDAETLITDHLQQQKVRLEDRDLLPIMDLLISQTSDYVLKLQALVQADWEKQHQTQMQQAQTQLDGISRQEQQLRTQLEQEKQERQALRSRMAQEEKQWHEKNTQQKQEWEQKLLEQKKQLEDMQTQTQQAKQSLAESLQDLKAQKKKEEDTWQKRIQDLQSQCKQFEEQKGQAQAEASALQEELKTRKEQLEILRLATPPVQPSAIPTTPVPVATFHITQKLTTKEPAEVSLPEAKEAVLEALVTMCDREETAQAFMLLLLSSYAKNHPLLLTGSQSMFLADFYAQMVTGKHMLYVDLDDHTDRDALIQALEAQPHDMICFPEGLSKDYETIRYVMDYFPQSRYVLTCLHEESLILEPQSLYVTFLPVYTDQFCLRSTFYRPSGDCKKALVARKIADLTGRDFAKFRTEANTYFQGLSVFPAIPHACAGFSKIMNAVGGALQSTHSVIQFARYGFLLYPYLRATGHADALKPFVQGEKGLSPEGKQVLMDLISASEPIRSW